MIHRLVTVAVAVATVCLAAPADAKDRRNGVAAATPAVPVQDCSVFYDDYARRGFGWGSGPGSGLGFGTFEGALPRYVPNQFPNWYGACENWGHYSATGSARW